MNKSLADRVLVLGSTYLSTDKPRFTPGHLLILARLAAASNWLDAHDIGISTRFTRRYAREILQELEAWGYVEVLVDKDGHTKLYKINTPAVEAVMNRTNVFTESRGGQQ